MNKSFWGTTGSEYSQTLINKGIQRFWHAFKSRIAFHVSFDDYTEGELLDITKLLARERGMLLDGSAEEKLLSIYADARQDRAFGNGRFARNLLEQAKFNQANRLMRKELQYLSDDEIRTLTAEDFDYAIHKKESRQHFGFSM